MTDENFLTFLELHRQALEERNNEIKHIELKATVVAITALTFVTALFLLVLNLGF